MITRHRQTLFLVLALFASPWYLATAAPTIDPSATLQAAAPVVLSCSPDTATAGTIVTIRGSGFSGTTRLLFGNVDAYSFTVVSDSTITATVGSGGPGPITVETPGGNGILSMFTYYQSTTNPHITSVSPDTATTGQTVYLHGAYLSPIKGVLFGFTAASSFTVLSDSLVAAVVGSGASGLVLVEGPTGTGSLPGFTWIGKTTGSAPVVTAFSPDSAGSGTTVMIHGMNFTGADTVVFGGTGVFSYTVLSDTLIRAVVGVGATGPVVVEGPGGAASLAGFTYIAAPPIPMPVIISFTPDSAAIGATVMIHGYYFTGVTEVTFGSPQGSAFTVVSDTLIRAVVGPASSGVVQVDGPGGYDNKDGFILLVPPHLKEMYLYPNPAIGVIQTVSVPGSAASSRLELTDIDGRILKVIPVGANVNQVQVNTTGLQKGVYKLVWTDGQHSSNQTILVL